jgi:superkiller protein 3
LGVVYGHQGLIKESRAAFEKVISIDPKYSKAYFNLGVLYSNGKSENSLMKSIHYFDTYLSLEPEANEKDMIERWKLIHANSEPKKR